MFLVLMYYQAKHIKIKMMATGISLFAGAGGLDLGFKLAGGETLTAIEMDKDACNTLASNFPYVDVRCDDVTKVSGDELPSADIVFGGPPCQAFSMIGKRSSGDTRRLLVWEFHRIIQEVRPRAFVMENVMGMTYGEVRANIFDPLVTSFKDLGYKISVWALNAAEHGTPQLRKRIFVVGAKSEIPEPEKEAYMPTVRDALSWLPPMELSIDGCITAPILGEPSSELGRHLCYSAPIYRLHNCNLSSHSPSIVERYRSTSPGTIDGISRFPRLTYDPIPESRHGWAKLGVAPTLRAGTGSSRGTFTAAGLIHPRLSRKLTPRECACLSGFPGWYVFDRRISTSLRQIGNAVPPLLAKKVLAQVIKYGLE